MGMNWRALAGLNPCIEDANRVVFEKWRMVIGRLVQRIKRVGDSTIRGDVLDFIHGMTLISWARRRGPRPSLGILTRFSGHMA